MPVLNSIRPVQLSDFGAFFGGTPVRTNAGFEPWGGVAVAAPPPGAPVDDHVATATRNVLNLLFRHRRHLFPGDPCATAPCPDCYRVHGAKIEPSIAAGRPIGLVILAFPAKSPNRRKTLGPLPDLAEHLALNFLQLLCDQIRHFHPPGARIVICADGHVFGDLVSVPDPDITAYRDELLRVLDRAGLEALSHFSLTDAYGRVPVEQARRLLLRDFGTPLPLIRERVRADPEARASFNGIHRFMFEDLLVARPGESRNRVRAAAKDLAYQVTRHSNAWSDLVADVFPGMARLSIHPQPGHTPKLGIHLLRTRDNWLTPWHGVALDDGDRLTLVKRGEAERLGASMVLRDGRPSHYVAPHITLQKVTP